MALTLGTKIPSSGNIRVWWDPAGTITNYAAPTAAEINNAAVLDISDSISWNDFDFGLQASNTIDDPAITAIGKVSDRGAAQFGGGMSFYYPKSFDDASNTYSETYDSLSTPRTAGLVVVRIDGEKSSAAAATGDLVHVFSVMTDGYAESITGEEAFRYTVNFLSQGDLAVRTYVGAVTTIDIVEGLGTIMAEGDVLPLHAYLNENRVYTNGLQWTSSNPAAVSVSTAGVLTCHTTATTTITATYEATGTTATFLVND